MPALQLNLRDELRAPLAPGNLLGQGGEGSVYDVVGRPGQVLKVYAQPITPRLVEKLRVLTKASPEARAVACLPDALAYDATNGKVRGFLMHRLTGRSVHDLFHPSARRECFPKASLLFLAKAAYNLCAVLDTLHSFGIIVGDVNFSNFMIASDTALVTAIDTDSFQVRRGNEIFLCEVGHAEYTPPELLGRDFSKTPRHQEHDSFGLAILVFQLLMVGRHPFCGMYYGTGELPLDRAISERRYAFGVGAQARQVGPPAHTPDVDILPPRLRQCLERAFLANGNIAPSRPLPGELGLAVKEYLNEMQSCREHGGHHFWKGLNSCPWCAQVFAKGIDYFDTAGTWKSLLQVDVQEIKRRLNAIPAPKDTGDLNKFLEVLLRECSQEPYHRAFPRSGPRKMRIDEQNRLDDLYEVAVNAAERLVRHRARSELGLVLSVLGGLAVLSIGIFPSSWSFVIGPIALVLIAGAVAYYRSTNGKREAASIAKSKYREAWREISRDCWASARAAWDEYMATIRDDGKRLSDLLDEAEYRFNNAWSRYEVCVAEWRHLYEQSRQHILQGIDRWTVIQNRMADELAALQAHGKEEQLERHLRSHAIWDARIQGVGATRRQTLSYYGIDSAADITEQAVSRVPGFGPALTQALLDWRRGVESMFRHQPNATVSPERRLRVETQWRAEMIKIQMALERGIQETESAHRVANMSLRGLWENISVPAEAVVRYKRQTESWASSESAALEEQRRLEIEAMGEDDDPFANWQA